MRKIGIVTINDNYNLGNRLQNYATYKILSNYGDVENILTSEPMTYKDQIKFLVWKMTKRIMPLVKRNGYYRRYRFMEFNSKIKYSKLSIKNSEHIEHIDNKYDFLFFGSDQIWNPEFGHDYAINPPTQKEKNIALCASIGVDEIAKKDKAFFVEGINKFSSISVREDSGAKIVKNLIAREVPVLIDPTMCVDAKDWRKLEEKPMNFPSKRYILLYFLGEMSELIKQQINELAKRLDVVVLDILSAQHFNDVGPKEFLYLIDHAEMVITDSFHACVFSILLNTSFYVLDRKDVCSAMNSRLITLLTKMNLIDRMNSNISSFEVKHDYKDAYERIPKEREKFIEYVEQTLKTI